ncbi:peptidase M23 [Amylibacter marinus]|uniref:Peptidase M23 n=2 Tax=Amylibacter marinus TaxID=1475483 RepID=A0ABQ5VST3_9RHOB|nr:peptidase M23 [Amylibacter marinus]
MLERHVPEQRIYIRSEKTTRYLRFSPLAQTLVGTTVAASFSWMVVASVSLAIQSISENSKKEQAEVLQSAYESRLAQLASERDQRSLEAQTSLERFYIALDQVSLQQSEMLKLEEERRELGRGLKIMQRKLQDAIKSRDEAQERSDALLADLQSVTGNLNSQLGSANDTEETLAFVTNALEDIVIERDALSKTSTRMKEHVATLELDAALLQERGNQIFDRLEDAVDIALSPMSKALDRKGINSNALISEVKRGYSGTGGPLTPLEISTESLLADEMSARASGLLRDLDRVNLMKLAMRKVPLGHPVAGSYRYTSGFGYRRDPKTGGRRLHKGTDMAGPLNTKIVSAGDGVVTFAGTQSGYGRLVKIKHSQGFETFYAHLNKIMVKSGQKVSLGDQIGAMGNSGRSTGVHLHYEIRLGGQSINAKNYMEAAKNVF